MAAKTTTPTYTDRLALLRADPSANPPAPVEWQLVVDPSAREAWLSERLQCERGSRTMAMYHGRHRAYGLSGRGPIDAVALSALLAGEEVEALLARICAAYSEEWNGSNVVGRLDDDASAAEEALQRLLEDCPTLDGDGAGLWDAADWLDGMGRAGVRAEYGITAETTDEQTNEIAAAIESDARYEQAVLVGTRNYVVSIRDELCGAVED